jgi:hypothetical protein
MLDNGAKNRSQTKKQILLQLLLTFLYGAIPGVVSGVLIYFLAKVNIYSTFVVLVFWLILGWFSADLITIKTLTILTFLLSGLIGEGVTCYLFKIRLWFLSIHLGLLALFWSSSLISRILLIPIQDQSVKEENGV